MHPRKLVRDTIGFAFTQYIARAAFMLRGLIAARLLGPGGYGAWNALQLIGDYGIYAQLGTQQGLDQVVPAYLVDGDTSRLGRLLRAGLFNVIVLTLVFSVGALFYFGRTAGAIRASWGISGVAVALTCVLLANIAAYHLTVLRSYGRIQAVSLWFALQGTLAAAVGLGLIPWLGARGLLWGWFTANLVALLYVRWQSSATIPIRPAFSSDSVRLVQSGFPMLLYLTSSLVMRTIDRIVILRFLGTQALGFYSLGVMMLTLLLYLPDSITFVLYPQLLRGYREGGDEPAAIRPRVLRALFSISAIVPGLCGLAFLGAREAVLAVLPNFLAGAAALRVLCFGAAGLAIAGLCSIVLMTVRRQLQLIPAALFATTLGAGLDIFVLRSRGGIDGVAWATFSTYCTHGAVMLFLASRALGLSAGGRLRAILRAYLPLGIALGLAVLLDRNLPWYGTTVAALRWGRLGLGMVTFSALYLACIYPLVRGLGLRALAEELIARRFARRAAEPAA